MASSGFDRMDFEPSPEQRRLIALATDFANGAGGALPEDALGFATRGHAALGAQGHFAVTTVLDAALIVASLARVSAALGATFASGWLFLHALRRHGTGSSLGAVAAGAEAGTRAGAVALERAQTDLTVAEQAGELIVTGSTDPIPLGPIASDLLLAMPSSDGDALLVCIDLSARGAHKASPISALGLEELPRGAVELARAAVPRERVLAVGDAAAVASRTIGRTRAVLTAAVAVGVAGSALDRALSHVRQGGKLPQSTEFVVSDLATGYDAAFFATAHAAWQRDRGTDTDAESAAAKLLAARTATEVCHGALSVCGESGYHDALRRAYLDARYLELYDGAEAEQIDVIASQMLGES
jgi:alkylation response protein AidB-like acyl-CoA dehydrogenase